MNRKVLIPSAVNYPALVVIDQLMIGPVKIEHDRLIMPYTVLKNGQSDTNELIYKYEEKVFDPHSPESRNLASMIGAQVGLNYGLFCKEIVFDGLFDHTDRRFLTDMMENTSREILVNKIFQPNVFLTDEVKNLEVRKQKRYTQAGLAFVNSKFTDTPLEWSYWSTDKEKHCVLSSGGKDSLLSYALLKELDKEVYPIFGNESGRHWFTALNGYRHLKENDPNTGRVWMNSDRIFSWMLRHLSFVRQDFSRLRADDYPVRLWTVAVFLFGVLPLMKKKGVGRLVIGDEYDSSQKGNYQGITHYNGLYDQSGYFDEAVTRFFLKKGWSISQFSLLRSMSELLILKTLVKRYPELQRHQTSCHATHERDGRIYPCGKCEKCRRIVGMLRALDAEPQNCGYSEKQIEEALASLTYHKVKQIGPDAAHLYHLLNKKGLLTSTAKAHPEIMKLRFDKGRSYMAGIPSNLRRPLFSILLEYADGAIMRVQRKWQPVDLLESPEMQVPYPFETEEPIAGNGSYQLTNGNGHRSKQYLWAHLTWEEASERTRETDIALLPVGAIEQHGPHLPLDVDAFDADYLARKVAEACSDPKPLVMPLVPYGVSYHHDDFPGTISITNEAMSKYIYDIGVSLHRNGIRKLIIINGHGDNAPTLNFAAQMINRDTGMFVCVDTGETSDSDIEPLTTTHNDIHAGEVETSTTLAIRPELVRMDKAQNTTLKFSNRYLDFSSKNYIPWYVQTKKISEDGTMGDPTVASIEKGQKIWEIMISHLVAFVEAISGMDLEEIYQKRY